MVSSMTSMARFWVSGSSETKTYGKDATVREREEKLTLPRRGFFRNVDDATCKNDARETTTEEEGPTIFFGKIIFQAPNNVEVQVA